MVAKAKSPSGVGGIHDLRPNHRRKIEQAVEKVRVVVEIQSQEGRFRKKAKENTELLLDKSFQVLPRCHHHSFDIHLDQTSQAKPSQPVEFLRFAK